MEWWTVTTDGYYYRLAGTFAEWVMAIFMIVFVLSFTNEFKNLEYEGIIFKYNDQVDNIT